MTSKESAGTFATKSHASRGVAPDAMLARVLYRDGLMLVIDKPAGLVVHPAAGNQTGTLVNALIAHCGESLSGIGGVKRPGIVHRLDKDTSGLMVVAKTDQAHRALAAQFADRLLLLHEGRILADGSVRDVLTEEHLRTAFGVTPVLLTNPATGRAHLAFEDSRRV